MQKIWQERSLELIVLSMFMLVVSTATLILYSSYGSYLEHLAVRSDEGLYEYKVIMFIALSILFLSLLIVYVKRDFFFQKPKDNHRALAKLLEDIKYTSDPQKVAQFKEMLKKRNHQEIYQLISSMINELQESKKMADDANTTKTRFLTNISHEIRTPLNGIVGFSKLLNSTPLDGEQQDFVHTIRKSTEDLIGIVDDILDIAKIESGRVELEESYFNIIDEFEGVIESYAVESAIKEIDLSLWIDPLLVSYYVQSDYKKIRQILINLISNAIKFTPQGGKIHVSITATILEESRLRVIFGVSDTGMGISEEQKDRVFDLFTQGDSSSTREHGGTGLGLAISTQLVRILGGSLSLKSKLNHGSEFSFGLEMVTKLVKRESKPRAMKVALYAPSPKEEDQVCYLESYLNAFPEITLRRFESFVACQNAEIDSFDLLYIHYETINKDELKRLVARHSATSQLVLVTKLTNRDLILDIAPIFSQVIYEPLGYFKVERSLLLASQESHYRHQKASPMFHGLKALVIDDNRVNQKMIVKTLETIGVTSDTAIDGQEGVEIFQKNCYDVVFMDIQMPVMNGVVATKEILKYEQANGLAHTPIIAVTTNNLEGDRERYLEAGMDEYIAKPIDIKKFINVLKQFYVTSSEPDDDFEKYREKDILLYKELPMEGKIFSTIFEKMGYSVDIAKNIEQFASLMGERNYQSFILDKSRDHMGHAMITERIAKESIPSLLFVDDTVEIEIQDMEIYTHVLAKDTQFNEIKKRVKEMLEVSYMIEEAS